MPNSPQKFMMLFGVILAAGFLGACGKISATDPEETVVLTGSQAALMNYAQNCSACHGAQGVNGAARQLADANYLASVGRQALISITTNGVPGGFCPGFGSNDLVNWISESDAKTVTEQIDKTRVKTVAEKNAEQFAHFVDGLLQAWGKNGAAISIPWSVRSAPAGNASSGQAVYATMCQSCHGAPGTTLASTAGSVTDPNYLRLITDQGLRSAVLFGRPDRGMPSWSGPFPNQAPDRTLSSQEISDVVAFLRSTASQKQ